MKRSRPAANLLYEQQVRAHGFERVVGLDEAGRGTWAGPVCAAAVALPLATRNLTRLLTGVRDSKELLPRQREDLVGTIKATASAWGLGSADNDEVDALGIVPATKLAMARALTSISRMIACAKLQMCFGYGLMTWSIASRR